MSYCPACGHKNDDDARFCGSCGAAQGAPVSAPGTAGTPASPAATGSLGSLAATLGQTKVTLPGGRTVGSTGLIAAVVIALAVLATAYALFLAPMDESEYEAAIDTYSSDLTAEVDDYYTILYTDWYYYMEDTEAARSRVDSSDLEDLQADLGDVLSEMQQTAIEVRTLRAPKRYRNEQDDIQAGAKKIIASVSETQQALSDADGEVADRLYEDLMAPYTLIYGGEDTGSTVNKMWRAVSDVLN